MSVNVNVNDPAFVSGATVEVNDVSVWFDQKVALSEVSCSFGPGVTGLLGPNGAGKTTLMRAVCGLLPVNQGSVRVRGGNPRADRAVHRQLALVSEDDAVPRGLTARQLVTYVAAIHGISDRAVVDRALGIVELLDVADRVVTGFSKGMRQRAKVAAALVIDPAVLVLDEPLNGADPVQRRHLIDLFRRLGSEGRTVVVSSHVLQEVERLAERVIVIVRGRLAAAGDRRAIRDAMDDRPRHVVVRAVEARKLAATLLQLDSVAGITVEGGEAIIATTRAREVAVALPQVAKQLGITLQEVRPLDDSLESLFRELVR